MRKHLFKLSAAVVVVLSSCAGNPPPVAPPKVPRVVLVHGFSENGKTFAPLRKRLEKRGFVCYTAHLLHNDGRGGLENLAVHLKKDIDAEFGTKEPINIVAFSMGGLVSRYYLQELGGAERCKQLITISSPHNGTKVAYIYPTKGAAEMRPGSPFLKGLRATEGNLGSMPVTSYRTPLDMVILPPKSSVWDRADNVEYPVLMHPLMLNSGKVLDDIERRLER